MRVRFVVLALSLALIVVVWRFCEAQPDSRPNSPPAVQRESRGGVGEARAVTVVVELRITSAFAKGVHVTIAVPRSIEGWQVVSDLQCNMGHEIFDQDRTGNRYVMIAIDAIEGEATVRVSYDCLIASPWMPTRDGKSAAKLNAPERFVESDSKDIVGFATSIKTGESMVDSARMLIRAVCDLLDPGADSAEDRGALWAYRNREGDCTEYSDLFVAIARARGLSARAIVGYSLEGQSITPHQWAEVWLDGIGWFPVDPVSADTTDTVGFGGWSGVASNLIVVHRGRGPGTLLGGQFYSLIWDEGEIVEHLHVSVSR